MERQAVRLRGVTESLQVLLNTRKPPSPPLFTLNDTLQRNLGSFRKDADVVFTLEFLHMQR